MVGFFGRETVLSERLSVKDKWTAVAMLRRRSRLRFQKITLII